MKTFLNSLAAGSLLVAALASTNAAPAVAQSRQAEVIVYGTDPCPRETDSTIVVCVHRPEEERFRIPKNLRPSGPPQTRNSWVNRSKLFSNQGATGPMSCSAVGPAGYTGCALQEINQAARERQQGTADDTPPPK